MREVGSMSGLVTKHVTIEERRSMEKLHRLQNKMREQRESRRDYHKWIELQRQVMAILPDVPKYKPLKEWWL